MNTQCYVPFIDKNAQNFLFFITNLDLPMTEKYIYTTLALFTFGTDHTFVSQEKIAKACGCSLRTVQRAITRLQTHGFLLTATDGRLRKYYFTLPEQYREQYHTQFSTYDNLTHIEKTETAIPAKIAQIEAKIPAKLSTYDKLSPVFKKEFKNINTPPYTPPAPAISAGDELAKRGGGEIYNLEQKEKMLADFEQLCAVYPRKDDLPQAFSTFKRMYADLPPVADLLRYIDYEKTTNSQWMRDSGRWVPFLKNWLVGKQYQAVADILSISSSWQNSEQKPVTPKIKAPEPEEFDHSVGLEFDHAEFKQCILSNWKFSNRLDEIAVRGVWIALLRSSIKPTKQAATQAAKTFEKPIEWLRTLKAASLAPVA